ncbi:MULTISPECIES: hypothetical protein [Roseobacter]|uniref:Uncharacterized protein n=1 Tax=Roseobacter litoralis (strain ATCC 49566 / DSM 6996 / JCM 21268 / NBRC 15278 / OCh 149) TaxID=391595 RepID=F7ZCJ7_ROSLO|nr:MULTISPECIES: hypothetical protein [Roseobacter]AEI93228.1 hypothetical protein RLO149_c012260 [Roseobacter litoralis Och 149]GIT85156.1 hypothetical protein ROBYS_01720 [Roseobacter sp. OBYS 0001]
MAYQTTEHRTHTAPWSNSRLSLPRQGTLAAVAGILMALTLISVSQGPAQQSDIEDWHGNVASSAR